MASSDSVMPSDSATQKAQLGSDDSTSYDSAFIALCGASYAQQSSDIKSLVSAVTSWNGTGQWELKWGPATDLFQANLAFVAAYIANDTGLPICAALVIRGTDKTQKLGEFIEVVEDLHIGDQVPLPQANDATVLVAKGTIDGLNTIMNLKDPDTHALLGEFIAQYMGDASNGNPVLAVTGHSLGGCLTTVVAPWTKTLFTTPVFVKAVTFAAPTAGNPKFASWYAAAVDNSMLYYNAIDVVPMAWSNLDEIKTMFPQGVGIPLSARGLVDGYSALIKNNHATYGQTSPSQSLPGTPCGNSNWYHEALAQHHHATYISLMAGQGSSCSLSAQDLQKMMASGDLRLVKM